MARQAILQPKSVHWIIDLIFYQIIWFRQVDIYFYRDISSQNLKKNDTVWYNWYHTVRFPGMIKEWPSITRMGFIWPQFISGPTMCKVSANYRPQMAVNNTMTSWRVDAFCITSHRFWGNPMLTGGFPQKGPAMRSLKLLGYVSMA